MRKPCSVQTARDLKEQADLLEWALSIAAERLWDIDPKGFDTPDQMMVAIIKEAEVEKDIITETDYRDWN